MPEPRAFKFEVVTEKLKGIHHQVLIKFEQNSFKQEVGQCILRSIHLLIHSILNKEELPQQWKQSITVPVHKKSDRTDCNY